MCIYDWDYPPINHSPTPKWLFVYVPRSPLNNRFSKGISFLTNTDILVMAKANRYINCNPKLNCIPYRMGFALLISLGVFIVIQ